MTPSNRTGGPHSGPVEAPDWRPTLLAVAMRVLFGALIAMPLARWFSA